MKRGGVVLVLWLLAGPATADEVVFTNGDRLTGTIKKLDGGKLTVESDVAGEVTVDLDAVSTMSTENAVELHLEDGTVLRQRLVAGAEGEVGVASTDVVSEQQVPLAVVKLINPSWGRWSGSVSSGAAITEGNSETTNFHANAAAARLTDNDRIGLRAQYLVTRSKGTGDDDKKETTANNWLAGVNYDYFLGPRWYTNAAILTEGDQIADLRLRFAPSFGLGYRWVEGPNLNFSTEAGLAWIFEDWDNDEDDQDYVAARLGYHFDWIPREGLSLFHNLEIFPSLEDLGSDYYFLTDAGLRVSLWAAMFAETKFEWRHDETPGEDAEKDDYRYLLGIGWSWG